MSILLAYDSYVCLNYFTLCVDEQNNFNLH